MSHLRLFSAKHNSFKINKIKGTNTFGICSIATIRVYNEI